MHPDRVMAITERFSNSFRNDPDLTPERALIQAEGISRILATYPEEVVLEVTDLVRGLPSKQRFFPSLDEVKAACEAAIAPLHRAAARDVAILETHRLLAPPAPETPEHREAVVAKYWTSGMRDQIATPEHKAEKPRETPEEALARLSGLSLEEATAKFNALPAKENSASPPRSADLETSASPHDVPPPAGGALD
jgi:hypothetical protein